MPGSAQVVRQVQNKGGIAGAHQGVRCRGRLAAMKALAALAVGLLAAAGAEGLWRKLGHQASVCLLGFRMRQCSNIAAALPRPQVHAETALAPQPGQPQRVGIDQQRKNPLEGIVLAIVEFRDHTVENHRQDTHEKRQLAQIQ